jgi:hypothetical protein
MFCKRAAFLRPDAAAARIAKDKQLEIDASEIRIRAERRLGEMIREQKNGEGLAKPGPKPEIGTHKEPNSTPTLADIGISKKLSSRAQSLAAIPDEDFEVTLDEHRAQQQAVTVAENRKETPANNIEQYSTRYQPALPVECVNLFFVVVNALRLTACDVWRRVRDSNPRY